MDELYHYGVKGMKWGVRKDKSGGFAKKQSGRERLARAKRERAFRNLRRIGSVAVSAAWLGSVAYGVHQNLSKNQKKTVAYAASGKNYVDSFMKTSGKQSYSDFKKANRSDWTWADFAWAEVE